MRFNIHLKFVILLSAFCLFSASVLAQNSADSAYKKLKEKYGDLNSITVEFKQPDNSKGVIKAKKGNKYSLRLDKRIITCDGSVLWNYSEENKKVIISKFKDEPGNVLSIENFFFSILSNLKANNLKKESTSSGDYYFILTLEPSGKIKNFENLKSIKLWLKSNYDIRTVQFTTDNNTQTWLLESISINPKLSDKIFRFIPPKEAEVLDMR